MGFLGKVRRAFKWIGDKVVRPGAKFIGKVVVPVAKMVLPMIRDAANNPLLQGAVASRFGPGGVAALQGVGQIAGLGSQAIDTGGRIASRLQNPTLPGAIQSQQDIANLQAQYRNMTNR